MRYDRHANAERQLQVIDEMAKIAADQFTADHVRTLFDIATGPANEEVQLQAAVLLSDLYPTRAPNDPDFAQRTHTILLRDLLQPRKALAHPSCSWLVMTHLREENLAHIPWQSATEAAGAAECFYAFCNEGMTADESLRRVRDIVKSAGQRFVEQGRWEELFSLCTRVHLPAEMMDADLFRLRNALILYEQRRVRRVRRVLCGLLFGVVALVLLLSPLQFMFFENRYRSAHGMSALGFVDALYWSIITFATIGYGEIVPHTAAGRILAICDGLLGMIVMGLIAGLLLSYITPRPLP